MMGKDAEKLLNRKGEVLFDGETQVIVAPTLAQRASQGFALHSPSPSALQRVSTRRIEIQG